MKILILGASGAMGQQLVKQSLEKFHEVTALVRDPAKLNIFHEKLTIIKGNVLDETTLKKALAGNDAVVSALGVGKSFKSHNLMSDAVKILIPAMNTARVKRLIFLSAFGVGKTFVQANLIQKFFFRVVLKNIYEDKALADAMLRGSSLEWTLVYPVMLTDGPYTGNYKSGEKFAMKGMPKISRADVANFMLQQLTDNTFLKKTVVLMN